MDPSGAQHPQEMATPTLESMLVYPNTLEKKPKPQQEQALKCPRCDSTNTKFCYYNNYSLSQPRYFCKSCKRYWTQGGTLRNVPVGGGCRKTKRSTASPFSSMRSQDHPTASINPYPLYSNDPSLAFTGFHNQGGPHSEGLGNPRFPSNAAMFLDAPNVFVQNLCYGNGNGCLGNLENEGVGGTASEDRKPDFSNGESRVLWGIPWQNIGGDGNWMGNLDSSGREIWNGTGSLSWHGIVNSPLM